METNNSFDCSLSSLEHNNSLLSTKKTIRKKREKYMKISSDQRDQLLERVFFQNKKVKKVNNIKFLNKNNILGCF